MQRKHIFLALLVSTHWGIGAASFCEADEQKTVRDLIWIWGNPEMGSVRRSARLRTPRFLVKGGAPAPAPSHGRLAETRFVSRNIA